MKSHKHVIEFTVIIGLDHPAISGHFPGNPIVPGVLILGEVLQAIRQQEGTSPYPFEAQVVKFHSPLRPNQELRISIDPRNGETQEFSCYANAELVASGQLRYFQHNNITKTSVFS